MDNLGLLRAALSAIDSRSCAAQQLRAIAEFTVLFANLPSTSHLFHSEPETHPEYESLALEVQEHLRLIRPATLEPQDNDSTDSAFLLSFIPANLALDHYMSYLTLYFMHLEMHRAACQRNRATVFTMIEKGLVPLVMTALCTFLKLDERPWEELVARVSSICVPVPVSNFISSIHSSSSIVGSNAAGSPPSMLFSTSFALSMPISPRIKI